jgi:hypothetical protein
MEIILMQWNHLKSPIFVLLLSTAIFCLSCSGIFNYDRGAYFRELAYPEGRGSLLLFFEENKSLSEKLRIDVGLISENYGKELNIYLVEVFKKRNLADKHQIDQIPTLILFDNMGKESYRWIPWDFRFDFSPQDIERKIEKLPPPINGTY